MRFSIVLLAVAGLSTIAGAAYHAGRHALPAEEAAVALDAIDMPPASEPDPSAEPESSPTRAIVPDIVAPPFAGREGLARVEPRAPLGPIGAADRHGRDGPKPSVLFRPVAVAAGIVEAKGYRVRLAGIEIVPLDEKCSHNGTEWNCGIVARTAFRNFLRGRALSCTLPDGGEKQVVLPCRLGKEDPAMWLARQGWARAASDQAYAPAGEEARRQRRGIFGPPPG